MRTRLFVSSHRHSVSLSCTLRHTHTHTPPTHTHTSLDRPSVIRIYGCLLIPFAPPFAPPLCTLLGTPLCTLLCPIRVMIARRALNQGVQVQGGLACLPTGTAPTDPEQQHAIDFLYETICPLPIHLAHAQRLGYDVLARATAIDLVWAGKGALAKEWIAPDKAEPAYNRALLFCPDDEREAATAYAKALRVDTQEEGSAGSEGMGDAQPWLRVDPQGGSGAKRPKPAGSDRGAAGGSSSSSSSSSTSQSQQQFTSPTSTPLSRRRCRRRSMWCSRRCSSAGGRAGRCKLNKSYTALLVVVSTAGCML